MSMATLWSSSSTRIYLNATCVKSSQRLLCSITPGHFGQTGSTRGKGSNRRRYHCFQSKYEHHRLSVLSQHAANTEVVDTSAALEEGLVEMEVKVDGMTCGHCTSRVEDALALPAVVQAIEGLGFAAEPHFPQEELPDSS